MSSLSGRSAAASAEWVNLRLAGGMLASLLTWLIADMLQARHVQRDPLWAVLDVIGHGAVAVYVALWVSPIWGWPALAAAASAAVLLDADHALTAGSLLPDRMMALGARPWPHSLLGLVLGIAAGWRLGGPAMAYAIGAGLFTHVVGDATAWPGVPLFVPLAPNPHVLVPAWSLPVIMGGFSAAGAALSTRVARRGQRHA